MKEITRKNKEEIITSLIFMFFALGFNIYRVQGDGSLYYAFLEGLLKLPNSESSVALQNLGFQQSGCAYFNAPFYFVAYIIETLFHRSWNFNGITLRQISINLASNFYMVLSIILAVKILKKFNFKNIILPVTSVLFSTSAFVVAVVMPSYNHTVDIFINTLFLYLFIKNEDNSYVKSFWLGALFVITILVRYINFVLSIPIIIYYLTTREYKKIKFFIFGFAAVIWIMPLIFYIYNGSALAPFKNVKGAMNFLFRVTSFLPVYSLKHLVHPLHGLFVWSPVLILSVLGLLVLPKNKEKLGYLFLGICFIFIIVLGFPLDWHGGWSFSNRYLVGLFPIYVIGLAAFLEKYGRRIIFPILAATLYSVFLFFNWYLCVINGSWGTPLNMFQYWIKGESPSFLGKKVNLSTFLHRIYEACRYKYLFNIIK